MLERALALLEALREQPDGWTLSEAARSQGLPRNTAYRILNTFLARDYVRRDGTTLRFVLSRRLAGMACDSAREAGLLDHALPALRRLRDATGETAVLSILDRGEGLVLAQAQGVHPFRFVCDPGTRQAVHASAPTKALLAQMAPAERKAAVAGIRFRRLTARTLCTRRGFEAELERVRRAGYAVDLAEALDGVHCVAAAVLDGQGRPVAALTVTGPADRLTAAEFAKVGSMVRREAAFVSRALGHGLSGARTERRRDGS